MSATKRLFDWAASSTIVHVAFAFVAMGGWAVFANRDHPMPQPLISGLAQGSVSALLTLFLKKGLEWMSPRFAGLAGAIAPPLITAATILAILIGVHTLAGTPEIAATIAVPWTVSSSYAALYNLKLYRARSANG